jgi:hypothetical protein
VLHDLGKYADRFQRRLEGKDSGLDHWTQGAGSLSGNTRRLLPHLPSRAITSVYSGVVRKPCFSGYQPSWHQRYQASCN